MKKILFALICFQSVFSFGQTVGIQWVRPFSGSGNAHGHSIAVDASGNVYTTGYLTGTADFDPGAGTASLTSTGGQDIYVHKFDANGNFLWAKSMGGLSNDEGLSVAVDASGNVYTTGYFEGTVDFDPGPGVSNLVTSGSYYDIFIQKLDANGNFVWVKQIGSTLADAGNSIAVDAGHVYITGFCPSNGTVDFDPGPGTYNLPGDQSPIFVLKLDLNGNFVWAKGMGGISSDEGQSVSVDASGNVYTAGHFAGTCDFDPGTGTYSLSSPAMDIFVQKLDANGNFVWARSMGGTMNDEANDIVVAPSGNVYITGIFRDTADFDPGPGLYKLGSAGSTDIFIQKLDVNGNFVWAGSFGAPGQDHGKSIAIDASENVYANGYFGQTIDFDPGPGTHNLTATAADLYILKLDQNGNFVWARNTEGSSADYGFSIAVSGANIYTTGNFSGTTDFEPGTGTYNLTSLGQDAYVMKLGTCQVNGTDVKTACGNYTWIDGNTYASSNTTATYTFPGGSVNGCDSIVTLNLTINQPTTSTITQTACGSYTLNGQNYTTSGTYTQTLTNAQGCDSTITLNLTIKQPTTSTITQTACGSYTLNGQTYATSGTYTQTLTNAQGCDSTITLNLTIKQPTTSTITQTACGSYTLNGQTYATSGTYTQMLTNAQGCDSTITLNLTIKQPTTSTITQTACGSYTLNGQTYATSGTYTQTLTNAQGCDSTITLNLTIKQPTTSTITQTACGSYTLNGQTYATSGTYTQTLTNAQGCDSTITLNLTINNADNSVTVNGVTLTANQAGATYQWVNCDNGNAPINGATAQSFTPSENGNYAVEVTANGCTVISDCITVSSLDIDENAPLSVKVYPNPTAGYVHIDMGTGMPGKMELMDMNGKLLIARQLPANATVDVSFLPAGLYVLKVQTNDVTTITRLVKN